MKTAILIHSVTILLALFISFFIFFRRKGDKFHKLFGWIFVVSMAISAISSFWIQSKGWFSPIHILSVFTIYWLIRGVLSVRFKNTSWKINHVSNMSSAFIAILIAGIGVFVRHVVDPGNTNLGFIASAITAAITIPIMVRMTNKYK